MSQALSVAFAANNEDNLAGASANLSDRSPDGNVSLRGTTRGLEILISGAPSTAVLASRLTELLAEAPGFFAGSSARVAIDGALPSGALACLEEVTTRFEVQIVEIGPVATKRRRSAVPAILRPDDVPQVHLAEGTGPIAEEPVELCGGEPGDSTSAALLVDVASSEVLAVAPGEAAPAELTLSDAAPTKVALAQVAPICAAPVDVALIEAAAVAVGPSDAAPVAAAAVAVGPSDAAPATAPAAAAPSAAQLGMLATAIAADLGHATQPGPRLVIGPVRSGVIVDHQGHVIVIGDVNPGAEVRAEGSIIVLGRLRGVAHAAIGRDAGCIIALSLAPQQLRIGRVVARAADADRPSDGAEIAYATGETIVVERFLGRLPSGLAASM